MQGHALYYGRGGLADEWFDKLGYTLPYRVNVADFILDLSSADVHTESKSVFLAVLSAVLPSVLAVCDNSSPDQCDVQPLTYGPACYLPKPWCPVHICKVPVFLGLVLHCLLQDAVLCWAVITNMAVTVSFQACAVHLAPPRFQLY